jgi:hypothetical protein
VYSGRRFICSGATDEVRRHGEHVNLGGPDHQVESLAGGQHHGLTPSIERGIDHTWKSGFVADCCKQSAEAVRVIWDVLCAASAIDVHSGRGPMERDSLTR